jgi:hypothetical protein
VVRQQLSVPRRGYFEAGSHLALRPARVAATNCMPISEANKKYSKVISTININDLFYI